MATIKYKIININQYVSDLENQLKQQKKQIEEYQSYFSLLQKLLPRVPSIHDVIG